MIKKVKIDLIEGLEDDGLAIEKDVSVVDDFAAGKHWSTGKRFLIMTLVGITGLAVLLSAAGTFLWMQDKKAKMAVQAKQKMQTTATSGDKVVNLNGFVVNLKDNKGELKILVCDIALELTKGRPAEDIEKRVDVRNAVYKIAKSKSSGWWMLPEERQNIKKELHRRLNALLGENFVKTVYFTRIEVL